MDRSDSRYSRRTVLALATGGLVSAIAGEYPKLASNGRIVPTMIDAAAGAKITTHPLRRGLTMLEGSGGNIVVLSGTDGKLLVDGGFRVSESSLQAALAGIDPSPIKHLINTH